jgi:ribonucleoside-diphosphate reductase alpha chain
MRMLDNVIDINYYAVEKARNSNLRHRPVGMGIMGFCLHMLRAVRLDAAVSLPTPRWKPSATTPTWASTELAEERGRYARTRVRCGIAASCRRTR